MTLFEQVSQVLLPSLEHFSYLGYWVAFFAAFLETALIVGLLLPGSTLILLLGAFAAAGYLDFGDLIWFAAVGAILGDNLNFWLGQHFGQRWLRSGNRFISQDGYVRAHRFFEEHGARSVFLGRFVPTLKELIPFVAGSLNMRRRSFMFWNILGAFGWAVQWLGAGYLFARSLSLAQLWLTRTGLLIAFLLLFSLLLLWLKHLLLRHGQSCLRLVVSLWHSIKTAIATNPEIIELVKRHPRLFTFLSARLDRRCFSGLPLTFAVIAFTYALGLFGGIVEDLLAKDPIVAIDHSLAQMIAVLRTPAVIQGAIWVTELGVWQIVLSVVLLISLTLLYCRRGWMLAGLLVSVSGGVLFTLLGKLAFHRPRPLEAVLVEHSYAFPSGHAAIAVALYGFFGYLLIRQSTSWRSRVNLLFATIIIVLLIGLSRLVLGVHYLSDVLGGYLVGAMWLIVGVSVNEWLISSAKLSQENMMGKRCRRAVIIFSITALAGYVAFAATYHPRFVTPRTVAIQSVSGDPVAYLKQHLPVFTQSALGKDLIPLSLAFVARDEGCLKRAFLAAGWQPRPVLSLARLPEILQGKGRPEDLPLPPLFWNGRLYTETFLKTIGPHQIPRALTVFLWPTPLRTVDGRLFIGVAEAFTGIRWGLLHQLAPDLDSARNAVVTALRETGLVRSTRLAALVQPFVGESLTGQRFFGHGDIELVSLRACEPGRGGDAKQAGLQH